jgi:hypothetical protein
MNLFPSYTQTPVLPAASLTSKPLAIVYSTCYSNKISPLA